MKSTPTRGVKEILKPDAHEQSGPAVDPRVGGRVTAYLLHNGSASRGRRRAHAARRRRSESESEQGDHESPAADPKPGDLAMSRLKVR